MYNYYQLILARRNKTWEGMCDLIHGLEIVGSDQRLMEDQEYGIAKVLSMYKLTGQMLYGK